jgi:hypothetical protein
VSRSLRTIACIAGLAGLVVAGCGRTSAPSGATAAAHVARPTDSSRAQRWHLVKRPIVVVWLRDDAPPSYEVYFRLDASGTGYDGSKPPHCYTKGIDNLKDFPRSLLHPRAGDRMTVALHFRRPPRNSLTARVPLQLARPTDPPVVPSPGWWRLLGCSS